MVDLGFQKVLELDKVLKYKISRFSAFFRSPYSQKLFCQKDALVNWSRSID